MDIRTQSSLLAAIIGLALGISMLLRSQRPRVLSLFGVFSLSVGVFYLARFFEYLVPFEEGSTAGRVALGATIIIGATVPSTALSFFLEFLNFSPRAARFGRRASIVSILLGLVVGVTPLRENFWAQVAVAVWILLALSFSVSLVLARRARIDSRIEKLRLLYLVLGAAAAIVFNGFDFLAHFHIQFPSLGPLVATLYLYFLSQTLLRLRLMDVHELLGKFVSQAALAGALSSIFVILTSWAKGSLFLFNTLVATLVMLILLDPLGRWVEERVIAVFFRQRFAFLESMRALLRRSSTLLDVNELSARLLDGLNETRRVTHASVYLLAEDRPGFRLLDSRGPLPAAFVDQAIARSLSSRNERAQLIETVERKLAALKAQPLEARRQREEVRRLNDMKLAMNQMRASICVPLTGNDRLLGFLNLFDERVPEAFASDEIALILELADRLAGVLENSKLYEKMRERDRLAALGEMAAGLAHEIRNPLGAIKGAAQCLDPKGIPAEEREFVDVIVEEVNRLNGVVTAFLDYSRPLKQSFGATDLNEVVSRTMKLIQNDVKPSIAIEQQLGASLPRVDGDAEQLKQVLINLIQNGIQACGDNPGRLVVKTSLAERFGDFRGTDWVELQVIDDGPGIPLDQQMNIFVPFFTTKQKGTGLGLAICQRIVRNHGGTIAVQSRNAEGTTFIIRFPALMSPDATLETPWPDGTPLPGSITAPRLDDSPSPISNASPNPSGGSKNSSKKRRRTS
jgi:two-component system, NtrC family, sensor histidine kinase HydH